MEEIVSPDAPRWRRYLVFGVLLAIALAVILDPIIAYRGCRFCEVVHSHPLFTIIYYISFLTISGSLIWARFCRASSAVDKALKLIVPLIFLGTCFAVLITLSSRFFISYMVAEEGSHVGIFQASIGAIGLVGIPIVVYFSIVAMLEKAALSKKETAQENK